MKKIRGLLVLAVFIVPLFCFGLYTHSVVNQNCCIPLAVSILSFDSNKDNLAGKGADIPQATAGTPFITQGQEAKLVREITNGFRNWLLRGGLLLKVLSLVQVQGWNNETGLKLFIEFLQENPKYFSKFNKYVELLSRRNDMRAEQACLTDKEIEEVVSQGTVVAEWNGTIKINGTSYPCNYKRYVLNRGEETLKLLKIMIYVNGTVVDPYIAVTAWPLVAYIWPWGWINFGEDVYLHIRAPYTTKINGKLIYEADLFVLYINHQVQRLGYVATVIGAAIGAAVGELAGSVPGAVVGAIIGGCITPAMINEFQYEANRALVMAASAYQQGNNYGVKMVVKDHYLYPSNPFWWLASTISIWFVWPDNAWQNAVPELPIDAGNAANVANSILSYTWCWGTEVWVLPYYI